MQVVTEFCLMCGEDAAKKIENNLKKYSSKILEHAGLTTPDAGQFTERDMMLVLEAIDKCVKPSNTAGTTTSLISKHDVRNYRYMHA